MLFSPVDGVRDVCAHTQKLIRTCFRLFRLENLSLGILSPPTQFALPSDSAHRAPSPTSPPLSLSFGDALHIPAGCIHPVFAQHAARNPGLAAVEHHDTSITYRELDRLSDTLAAHLRSEGVARGNRVCLLVQRSIAMVVGIVGVLKAGAAYVPLDGGIVTDDALEMVLRDAQPTVVLCLSKFMGRMERRGVLALDLQALLDAAQDPPVKVKSRSMPSDEAYVIYTSGTTGRPKGVSVSHGNVTNLVCSSPGNLDIRAGTRVAQLLNIAFDMCAWEVLGCLANGGTLVLRGSSCPEWERVLRSVHVVVATPSILAQFEPRAYPGVRTVAAAGERCPQKLADDWAVGRVFLNCCGPTETTIINTAHRHTPGTPNTIGRPTPNNSVYVLDDDLRPVPIGAPGTLWAGGAGICYGYVNLPELTAERFRSDMFNPRGGVMYNTGDLGRLRADGEFDHLGRRDDQVKIKGFRVELDGVASAIAMCPGVSSAAALYSGEALWGFYAPADVPEDAVHAAVARMQPYYAVPSRYVALDRLPLTRNGKVDKVLLRVKTEKSV